MSTRFAASWRAVDQAERLDTALTQCFSARQRARQRERVLRLLLALSLVGNVVLTWRLWS